MKGKTFLLLFSILFLLNACKSGKSSTGFHIPYRIEFGESGGFTGNVIRYVLNERGELSKTESMGSDTFSKKQLGIEVLKEIKNLTDKQLLKNEYALLGNLSQFLTIYRDSTKVQNNIWSLNDPGLPEDLKILYEKLKSLKY